MKLLRISRHWQQIIKPNMGGLLRALSWSWPWEQLTSDSVSKLDTRGNISSLLSRVYQVEVCTEIRVVAGVRAPKWNGRHKALCLVCKDLSKVSSPIFVLGSPAQWLYHTVFLSGEKGDDYCSWWAILFWLSILNILHHCIYWVTALCWFLVRCHYYSPCPHGEDCQI